MEESQPLIPQKNFDLFEDFNQQKLVSFTFYDQFVSKIKQAILSNNRKMAMTHFEALIHYLNMIEGNSLFAAALIEKLHYWQPAEVSAPDGVAHPLQVIALKDHATPITPLPINAGMKLRQEQQYYCRMKQNNIIKFLQGVWNFAIDSGLSSKKVFISYAWPTGDRYEEQWTRPFIKNLAKHLIHAGIQVYIDQLHSGPGNDLDCFMKKIHLVDYVVVVGTRTMEYKLSLEHSGIRYELQQILTKLAAEPKSVKNTILLSLDSAAQFSPQLLEVLRDQGRQISLAKIGYLPGLFALISFIYNIDLEAFLPRWRKLRELNYIPGHLQNLPPPPRFFVGRGIQLAKLLSFINNNAENIINIYGLPGIGKTYLVREFLNTHGYRYDAIYWFDGGKPADISALTILVSRPVDAHILCIVKNLADISILPDQFKQGHLIVISRAALNFECITLDPFTEEEKRELIQLIIGKNKYQSAHPEQIQWLIETFSETPFSLYRICNYIMSNKISIIKARELFDKNRENIFPQPRTLLLWYREQIKTLQPINYHVNPNMINSSDDITPLSYIRPILEALNEYRDNFNYDKLSLYLGHLQSIYRYGQLMNDVELCSISQLIVEIKGQLDLMEDRFIKPPVQRMGNHANIRDLIAQGEPDSPASEQLTFTELKNLDSEKNIYSFLRDIWLYAIRHNHFAKTVVIIHVNDTGGGQEEWSSDFINILQKHLILAGVSASVIDFNIDTEELKESLQSIDHIILISSRSLELHAAHPNLNANEKVLVSNILKLRQIIPVLFNNSNHLSDNFRHIAELSFAKNNYLSALKALVTVLYGFDFDEFRRYWRESLILHKLHNNQWHVPKPIANFTGRKDQLLKMKSIVDNNENHHMLITACCGLGGVGKTSVVAQFVHLYFAKFHAVYWFRADSIPVLLEDFYLLMREQKNPNVEQILKSSLDDRMKLFRDWVSEQSQDCVIILDNAPNKVYVESLDSLKGPYIIVTSRSQDWKFTEYKIDLDVFEKGEAYEFILKELGSKTTDAEINNLIIKLERLPLALSLACAFIKNQRLVNNLYSINDYLNNFKIVNLTDSSINQSILITWSITFDHLKEESTSSTDLLLYCALLFNEDIPTFLLASLFQDEETFLAARRIAEEYSMIRVNEETGAISIHALVQQVIQYSWSKKLDDIFIKLVEAVHNILSQKGSLPGGLEIKRTLLPHLQQLAACCEANGNSPILCKENCQPYYPKLYYYLAVGYNSNQDTSGILAATDKVLTYTTDPVFKVRTLCIDAEAYVWQSNIEGMAKTLAKMKSLLDEDIPANFRAKVEIFYFIYYGKQRDSAPDTATDRKLEQEQLHHYRKAKKYFREASSKEMIKSKDTINIDYLILKLNYHISRVVSHSDSAKKGLGKIYAILLNKGFTERDKIISTALTNRAAVELELNNIKMCEELTITSLGVAKKIAGSNKLLYLTDLKRLAKVYRDQGRFTDALIYFDEISAIIDDYGQSKTEKASFIVELIYFYAAQGELISMNEQLNQYKSLVKDIPQVAGAANYMPIEKVCYNSAKRLAEYVINLRSKSSHDKGTADKCWQEALKLTSSLVIYCIDALGEMGQTNWQAALRTLQSVWANKGIGKVTLMDLPELQKFGLEALYQDHQKKIEIEVKFLLNYLSCYCYVELSQWYNAKLMLNNMRESVKSSEGEQNSIINKIINIMEQLLIAKINRSCDVASNIDSDIISSGPKY